MDESQKQAIKELLHLIVDKEETAVLVDLLGKLPAAYAPLAQALAASILPVAVQSEDKAIDAI